VTTRPYSAIGTLAGTGLMTTSRRPTAALMPAAPAGRATEHRASAFGREGD
jgi:hypothetical protein